MGQIVQSNKNLIISIVLIMFIVTLFTGCTLKETSAEETKTTNSPGVVYINLDSKDDALPKRFRKCSDEIDNKIGEKTVDLSGLKELNMSGSGQFSEAGLEILKQSIGDFPVVIVDLREESHGFVNGIALSWMDKDNKANKGLNEGHIISDENKKLKELAAKEVISFETDKSFQVKTEKVMNEADMVKDHGMSYLRLPVTNNEKPSDDVVDTFILFLQTMQEKTWLHFHCMEGIGRTTIFMVMVDALKNAKKITVEDIMNRQVLLGGKNLLQSGDTKSEAGKRARFIKLFYQYCRENNDNYKTLWSDWVKKANAS